MRVTRMTMCATCHCKMRATCPRRERSLQKRHVLAKSMSFCGSTLTDNGVPITRGITKKAQRPRYLLSPAPPAPPRPNTMAGATTSSSVSITHGNSAIPSVDYLPMVPLTTLNMPVLMVVSSSTNPCGAPTLPLEASERFREQGPFGSTS